MKKAVIGICISLLCIGTGVYVNYANNVSTPVVSSVAKQTKDSKVNTNESKSKVSKHEETEKAKEVGNATNSKTQKKTEEVSKESGSTKSESKSSTKTENKSSVASEGKPTGSSNSTSSSSKSEAKSNTDYSNKTEIKNNTNGSDTSKKEETKPVEKPSTPVQEPVVEPTPTPEPARPSYACPGGVNQDVSCDVILDQNHYFATYSSQAEAENAGVYYMNEVMYISEMEITNYSVQAVYRNNHSVAYYGLNLWSNGSLIQ